MRTLPIVIAAALALLATAPPASAGHCCGPCTHEWFDIVVATYDSFKQGGAKQALSTLGSGARACVDNSVSGVCDLVRCDVITLP